MYPRNAASPEPIAIGPVVQISDGAVQTSGVTVRIKPIGVSEADGAGSVAYSTDGIVLYTPTQGETNYTSFILIAKKSGCIPTSITIITTASATPGTVLLAPVTHTGAFLPDVGTVSVVEELGMSALIANSLNSEIAVAVRSELTTELGRIDAAISTRLSSLGTNAPSNWINAAAIAASAMDGKGNWNVGKTGYALTATTGLGNQTANITGTVSTVTTLTNLPSIPANWLTATGIASNAITDAKIASGAFTAAKFASGAFDAVWTVATRTLTSISDSSGITTLLSRIIGTLASGTHTAQSGDAFARLGAPVGASISADIATRLAASSYTAPPTVGQISTQIATDWDAGTNSWGDGLNALVDSYITPTFPANFGSLGINSSGHISRVTLVDTTTDLTNGGGGGGTDWTSTEKEQIRHRLGIDGTATAPSTATGAKLGDVLMTQLFVDASGTVGKSAFILRGNTSDQLLRFYDIAYGDELTYTCEDNYLQIGLIEANIIGDIFGKIVGNGTTEIVGTGVQAQLPDDAITAAKVASSALNDKGNWNVGKTGYSLTATTGLGNQTANITGNLTGSVGSVTGNVGGNVAGSVNSVTSAVTVGTLNNNVITTSSINNGAFTSAKFAAGAFDAVWTVTTRTLSAISDSSGITTLLSRITGLIRTKTEDETAETTQTSTITTAIDNIEISVGDVEVDVDLSPVLAKLPETGRALNEDQTKDAVSSTLVGKIKGTAF
jgi:hypothetical protein